MPDKAPLTCPAWGHSYLLAVFVCQTCGGLAMCYSCAEAHQDQAHEVVGRVRGIQTELASPQDEKNRLFNEGAEFALHLDRLKCPCGTPFLESADSAICCVCGTATCSDLCHKRYVQDKGLCLYTRNYIKEIEERRQGCRCIGHDEMTGEPGQYLSQVCGPRFVEAETIDAKTLRVRRGYSQFGRPLKETLEAMVHSLSVFTHLLILAQGPTLTAQSGSVSKDSRRHMPRQSGQGRPMSQSLSKAFRCSILTEQWNAALTA